MKKVLVQSVIGFVAVVAAFIGGTMVCEFCIPGTMGKYLTQLGEVIVGVVLFVVTLGVALLARFDRRSLFISAGLVPAAILLCMLPGLASSAKAGFLFDGLRGGLKDLFFVSRHTTLPVALAAALVFLIRIVSDHRAGSRAQLGASPNGGPAMPLGNSGVMEGPPSVS